MTKLFSGERIGARRKTTPPAEYARIVRYRSITRDVPSSLYHRLCGASDSLFNTIEISAIQFRAATRSCGCRSTCAYVPRDNRKARRYAEVDSLLYLTNVEDIYTLVCP